MLARLMGRGSDADLAAEVERLRVENAELRSTVARLEQQAVDLKKQIEALAAKLL